MEVVHPQVAGIDVHKKVIWVAVRLPGQERGQRAVTVRRFKAFWRSLQKMAGWLAELKKPGIALQHRPLGLRAHHDDRRGAGAQGRLELLLQVLGGLDVGRAAVALWGPSLPCGDLRCRVVQIWGG